MENASLSSPPSPGPIHETQHEKPRLSDDSTKPSSPSESSSESLSPSSPSPSPSKKSVRFSTVRIQEYPYILGDNPSVSRGPPLSIGWTPMSSCNVDLDKYEAHVLPERRTRPEFTMDAEVRVRILGLSGFAIHEITEAAEAARQAKELRRLSTARGMAARVIAVREASQSIRRRARSPKKLRSSSKSPSPSKKADVLSLSSGSGNTVRSEEDYADATLQEVPRHSSMCGLVAEYGAKMHQSPLDMVL